MPNNYPSAGRLREILRYNRRTGFFYWKVSVARCIKKGQRAGSIGDQGYVKIQINGVTCSGHRLAWLYVYSWLPPLVEHRNTRRADNRFRNLRQSNASQNQANRIKQPGTSSRFKGVTWNKSCGKWQAAIKVQGKNQYLGVFDIEITAHQAYCVAARQAFGEFARAS